MWFFPDFPTVGQGNLSYGGCWLIINPTTFPPWESNIFTSAFGWKHLFYPSPVCLEKRQAFWESVPAGRVFSSLFFPLLFFPPRNLSDIDMRQAASSIQTFARRLSLTQNGMSNPEKIMKDAVRFKKKKAAA